MSNLLRAPYFCTDPSPSVPEILEAVAARWAIEEQFHTLEIDHTTAPSKPDWITLATAIKTNQPCWDVKEVWGAGQQQVRNVWSNIGCWNLNGWLYTLVELICWDVKISELTDRSNRPWDNPDRNPSHANRKRFITRKMLHQQFIAPLPNTPETQNIRTLFDTLIPLNL